MIVEYTQTSRYTGLTFRVRCVNVALVRDEPYPPGGQLRVLYNAHGQQVSGPHLAEISKWCETAEPDDDIAAECAARILAGARRVSLAQLADEYRALGYRFDRSADCSHLARYMTGDRAGKTYKACGLRPVQIDDGLAAWHVDARRDANFQSLQALRDQVFAVHAGRIYEV